MSKTRFRKLLPLVSTLALILPLFLALAAPVSAATITVCASGCDHTKIQDAVDAANPGDVIDVYPGTYNESVDLNGMTLEGDITIRSVNSGGTPTAGTATVNGGAAGAAFETSSTFSGDVTIDGFIVKSTSGDGINVAVNSDVVIRDVIADSTDDDGIQVDGASGDVTIEDCTANHNEEGGIGVRDTGGNVTITRCTANDNDDEGFDIDNIGGNVTITNSTANRSDDDEGFYLYDIDGNVTITDCTANENEDEGIEVDGTGWLDGSAVATADEEDGPDDEGDDQTHQEPLRVANAGGGNVTISNCTAKDNGDPGEGDDGISVLNAGGDVTISNCTAKRNSDEGIEPNEIQGAVKVTACISQDNGEDGIDLWYLEEADSILVNGNIICGNASDGLELNVEGVEAEEATVTATAADATGNWWGCAAGPGALGCDTVNAIDGSVDSTPWIANITASAPASVIVGEPAIVSFQFSGGPPAVYLGEGPGDLHGDPTFIVTTDNGTVTGGFINAPHGVMEVTLVPQTEGTATVTVVGPCGLHEQIVLGVQAAAADFVPEPGSVVLLASGLMGLAGYAGLRMRRK